MKKIKLVTRRNLPETNSSSSHSVSICFDQNIVDTSCNLETNSEGYIYFPSGTDFGRGLDRYNDALHKALYIAASFYHTEDGVTDPTLKKDFEEVILEFTGAKGVTYEWDPPEKFTEDGEEFTSDFYNCPIIDHQSYYLIYEIIENKDVMKNFIFNSKSWLFIADDSGAPKEFYNVLDELQLPELIMSIDFKGSLGRVDFELHRKYFNTYNIEESEYGIIRSAATRAEGDLFNSLRYDLELGKTVYGWDTTRSDNLLVPLILDKDILDEWGRPVLIFSRDRILEFIGKRIRSGINTNITISELSAAGYLERVDWVSFPISVSSPEFGTIWE